MDMQNYLGQPVDRIAAAMTENHTAEQERMAREAGFPSYEAMRLWYRQRQQGGTAPQGDSSILPQGGTRLPRTWDEAKQQMMAWHPKEIFQMVADKMKQATTR